MNEQLIYFEDFKDYKAISTHVASKDIEPYILEAQRLDLQPFLGDSFYRELVVNYQNPAIQQNDPLPNIWKDLMEGADYVNDCGETVFFYGLKACVVYYTYSRFLTNLAAKVTRYGLVNKTNEYSNPVPVSERREYVNTAKANAIFYQNEAEKFICANKETYPLFRSNASSKKQPFRISASNGLLKYTPSGDAFRFTK